MSSDLNDVDNDNDDGNNKDDICEDDDDETDGDGYVPVILFCVICGKLIQVFRYLLPFCCIQSVYFHSLFIFWRGFINNDIMFIFWLLDLPFICSVYFLLLSH